MTLTKVTDQSVNIRSSVDEFMIKFFVALLVVMVPTRQPMLTKHTTITTSRATKNLIINSSTDERIFTD